MLKENALFNDKTIKRLCSKTKITAKQKKATKSWIEKLEADSLRSEREHYLEFNSNILRDLLGYNEGDIKFEVDNVEFSVNDYAGNRVIAFEVKGTDTKDLFSKQARAKKHETPVEQLWRYMSKDATPFGIVTNYRTFILFDYSKGQSKYHQFDFLEIKDSDDKLKEFISIFSKKSIVEDRFVEKLYDESVIEEREFTKEFYKLFHETRLMLIEEFKANEELHDEIQTPIHFAQLYLNRLMFILFAEDTGKLPPRIFDDRILKILESKELISEHSKYVSDTIRDLFVSVDKGATTPDKIFGFNGGLFEASIPPKIYFKDLRDKKFFKDVYQHSQLKKEIKLDEFSQEILSYYGEGLNPLIKNLLLMASFDFNTEVNVNILGHIFEHSITDIETLQEGDISRRKKEGVYYTPEYITDYICRNTIIPYLAKKDAKTARDLILEYTEDIEELEKKFKDLKILDPACGSGAFLIKAVDVLLEIHKEIQLFKQDEGRYTAVKKRRKVKKDEGQLVLVKWYEEDEARKIIENNIFGVDINEESIEITKLSLFLKIAKKNKKLIDLSQNIKCGNSLIDDEEIAGEKAFNWNEEFIEIFRNNKGFDIIICNPPWGAKFNESSKKYLKSKYEFATVGKIDSYKYFYEKVFDLVRHGGYISFITPNTFLYNIQSQNLRKAILDKFLIKEGIELRKNIFEDAPDVVPAILNLKLPEFVNKEYKLKAKVAYPDEKINELSTNLWMIEQEISVNLFIDDSEKKINLRFNTKFLSIKKKMEECPTLGDFFNLKQGTKPYGDKEKKEIELIKKDAFEAGWDKCINGNNIGPFYIKYENEYVLRSDKLHSCLPDDVLESDKIYFQRMRKISLFPRIVATFDDGEYHGLYTCSVIYPKENCNLDLKYILCLLNSKLINYWYKYFDTDVEIKLVSVKNVPILEISEELQVPFIEKAKSMMEHKKAFHGKIDDFLNWLKMNYEIEKFSKKLLMFYNLSEDQFFSELKKKREPLPSEDGSVFHA